MYRGCHHQACQCQLAVVPSSMPFLCWHACSRRSGAARARQRDAAAALMWERRMQQSRWSSGPGTNRSPRVQPARMSLDALELSGGQASTQPLSSPGEPRCQFTGVFESLSLRIRWSRWSHWSPKYSPDPDICHRILESSRPAALEPLF